MTASTERTAPRKCRAWCPECGHGINGTKAQVEAWAAVHNSEKHPPPKQEQR